MDDWARAIWIFHDKSPFAPDQCIVAIGKWELRLLQIQTSKRRRVLRTAVVKLHILSITDTRQSMLVLKSMSYWQKWKQGQAKLRLLKHVWEVRSFRRKMRTQNQAKLNFKTPLDQDLLLNKKNLLCFWKRDATLFSNAIKILWLALNSFVNEFQMRLFFCPLKTISMIPRLKTVFTREQKYAIWMIIRWYCGPCVRKITQRWVIWIAKFKWRSGPSFEMRNSNYASWCNFAYTWSKILSFEWQFKLRNLNDHSNCTLLLSCENSRDCTFFPPGAHAL